VIKLLQDIKLPERLELEGLFLQLRKSAQLAIFKVKLVMGLVQLVQLEHMLIMRVPLDAHHAHRISHLPNQLGQPIYHFVPPVKLAVILQVQQWILAQWVKELSL
jgi:hypothetical protein